MWHFSCRWYGPPEVDLNGYPRISNSYCRNIQIRRCEWTQGKKMTQSKSRIKNTKLFYMYVALLLQVVNCRLNEVKEVLVATHHTFTTTYFDNMWVQFFLGKKLMNIFDITQKYS